MTADARTAEIEKLEERIEHLAEEAAGCRKLMTVSRMAIGGGAAMAAGTLTGLLQFDPLLLFGGVTLIIGGIVFYGSNSSTLVEKLDAIRDADARRADLISSIGLRLVE